MSAMIQAALAYVQQEGPIVVEPAVQTRAPVTSPNELAESVVSLEAQWLDTNQLALFMHIEPPYHVNTNAPAKDLTPTQISVADAQMIESIDYPRGKEQRFAFSDTPLRVYSGDVQIRVRFREPITTPISMTLQYQPCDDSACLAPVTKRFKVPPP